MKFYVKLEKEDKLSDLGEDIAILLSERVIRQIKGEEANTLLHLIDDNNELLVLFGQALLDKKLAESRSIFVELDGIVELTTDQAKSRFIEIPVASSTRHGAFHTVSIDPQNAKAVACTCEAGHFGNRCKHLAVAEREYQLSGWDKKG